jgi:hypothetical protein
MAMVLNAELLDRARSAATESAEAERQVLVARAEYHTAVRRLHLAGGSLREIAEALNVSHQRVQQIVSGAGGTWWRRMWGGRNLKPDAVCTWCGRPPSEVTKLVAGPKVYICDGCVDLASKAFTGNSGGKFVKGKRGGARRCSFCGKRGTDGRSLAAAAVGNVCSDCLKTCREIMSA